MIDVTVTGAESLASLAKALKAAGDEGKGLRKDLLKGIRGAAKPLTVAARGSAAATLPRRGGLAASIAAKTKIVARTRLTGRGVGVRMSAGKARTGLEAIDRGRLRHPVFGNRHVWVTQAVHPGWFTRPMEAGAPVVQVEILQAMRAVESRIEGAV